MKPRWSIQSSSFPRSRVTSSFFGSLVRAVLDQVLPALRADLRQESARLSDAGFAQFFRIPAQAAPAEAAQILGIDPTVMVNRAFVLGGVLTVMGFGAFGKHPRNVIPIFIGVLTLGFFTPYDHTSTTAVLAGLFGTTLAPIAGYFGAVPGILAGFIHMTMVLNVGVLHSGVNLYNNGFSGGFVAAILVPVLEIVQMRHLLPKQLWEKFRKRHTQAKIQAGKRVDTGEN